MRALRLFRDSNPEPTTPLATHVTYIQLNGKCGTAIGRMWENPLAPTCGDLCDPAECTFHEGFCLVGVAGFVPRELCPFFKRPAPGG